MLNILNRIYKNPSRTKALLDEFAQSFYWADELIILPTYAARESKDKGIDGSELASYINKTYPANSNDTLQ